MKKVFWTKEEREAVVANMARALVQNPLLRREQLFAQGQEGLPQERRRNYYSSLALTLQPMFEAARAAAAAQKEKAAEPPAALAPAPLSAVFEQLLDAIADRVVQRLQEKQDQFVVGALQEKAEFHSRIFRPKHNPQPACADRPVRPGVLIIGLLNSQAQCIINQFPSLDITCLTSEEGYSKPRLPRAHTVLMTKFIKHSVQDKYRKSPNLTLCHGGMSDLASILSKIA